MHRISSILRITVGLTCLSVAVLLCAQTIGLIPDHRVGIVQGRAALCESLAIHCSRLAAENRVGAMKAGLEANLQRNPDMVCVAVRRAGGTPLVELHDPDHTFTASDREVKNSLMTVPILSNGQPWGTVEVGFRPLQRPGFLGFVTRPLTLLCLFFTVTTAALFFLYLRKLLQDLDPSKVVPDRVRTTLNTLAEGLLVLDEEERIVLANQSFAKIVGQSPDQLLGHQASNLPWLTNGNENNGNSENNGTHGSNGTAKACPWLQTIREGKIQSGQMLGLQVDNDQRKTFVVNSSPILGEDGKARGALASFDDVTAIERNRVELQNMLDMLKTSRDEIRRKNHELQVLATRDPLTGCWNRRAFFEQFETQWGAAQRHGHPISCILLDIDHFKSVNDVHGHSVGDQVLEKLAALLNTLARNEDVVCRYGGEEFCILLPHTDIDEACLAAERYRAAVEALEFPNLSVTSSFGVSALQLGPADPQEMIDQADKCLYVAKRGGRNQVSRWDEYPDDLESEETEASAVSPEIAPSSRTAIPFPAVTALVSALSYRDTRTAEHSRRVADRCVALASRMMSASEAYVVEIGGLLHDIGKIGVPDAILLKPGPLTDEEWELMGLHDNVGVGIIQSSFDCPELTEIVQTHHAWYSGNPREPDLPTGKDIPLGARILSLADAYDAIVSDRVYRAGRSQEEAFAELRRCATVQFDPDLVEPFIECVLACDANRQQGSPVVSKQTALNIGLQMESLAYAVDSQETAGLAIQAAILKETAVSNGVSEIADLAGQLEARAAADAEQLELLQLTNELLTLCRSTQTAYLANELPTEDRFDTIPSEAEELLAV